MHRQKNLLFWHYCEMEAPHSEALPRQLLTLLLFLFLFRHVYIGNVHTLLSGKHFTTTGINSFRIEGGKIVEHWDNSDDLDVMQQIGLIT
jgi:SnoaL-like polyketide cyclase